MRVVALPQAGSSPSGRAFAGIAVCEADPLAQGGLGQFEVRGDLGDAAVADAAEADGLSLAGGREREAGTLLPDCLHGLLPGALLSSILARLGVHEAIQVQRAAAGLHSIACSP